MWFFYRTLPQTSHCYGRSFQKFHQDCFHIDNRLSVLLLQIDLPWVFSTHVYRRRNAWLDRWAPRMPHIFLRNDDRRYYDLLWRVLDSIGGLAFYSFKKFINFLRWAWGREFGSSSYPFFGTEILNINWLITEKLIYAIIINIYLLFRFNHFSFSQDEVNSKP